MKSLQRRFNKVSLLNPKWSSLQCFFHAVEGCHFSRKIIMKYFNRSVEEDDYDKANKKELIKCLDELSSRPKKDPEAGIK